MSDGISMTFMNYSQTNWDQSASLTNDDEDWGISSLSTYPSSTLAQGASTSMSVDENIMGNVDKGQITISCGWYDTSVSDSHWGVKIYVPVQVFDIGSRPYYLVVETETEDWTNDSLRRDGEELLYFQYHGGFRIQIQGERRHDRCAIGNHLRNVPDYGGCA